MDNRKKREAGVSVVVCCFNSEIRLPDTLRHLARQKVSQGVKWEVVLVDNASTDNTAVVAEKEWSLYGMPAPLTVVCEENPGLSMARRKGIEASRFEFIIFVDDDNWLCTSYVNQVYTIFKSDDQIGVIGGYGEPVFETNPPEWFSRYAHYFALGDQSTTSEDNFGAFKCVYGAGMAIRQSAWEKVIDAGFESILSDRTGGSLVSGGDHELCLVLNMAGYKVQYFRRLVFKHYITENRLTWPYLLKLTESIHFSNVFLEPYYRVFQEKLQTSEKQNTRWIKNTSRSIKRLAKCYKHYMIRRAQGKDVTEVQRRMIKCIGELKGWWRIRRDYTNLSRKVEKLKENLNTEIDSMADSRGNLQR